MGRWTYYLPLLLGTLLTPVLVVTHRDLLPALPPWQFWVLALGLGPAAGLLCQLVMVAAQGAFAQVLPVPGGRSVRGRAAVAAGTLLLLGLGLGLAAILLAFEQIGVVAIVLGILCGGAALAAIVAYAWSLPTAVRDFADER